MSCTQCREAEIIQIDQDDETCYAVLMEYSSQKRYRNRIRYEVLSKYSKGVPKCDCCSEPRLEFLSIDHLNGGGAAHRKSLGGGGHKVYRWLRANNFPPGYRVLCQNCNQSLGQFGYCPHQVERGETEGSMLPELRPTDVLRDKVLTAALAIVARGEYPSLPKLYVELKAKMPNAVLRHRRELDAEGKWPVPIQRRPGT